MANKRVYFTKCAAKKLADWAPDAKSLCLPCHFIVTKAARKIMDNAGIKIWTPEPCPKRLIKNKKGYTLTPGYVWPGPVRKMTTKIKFGKPIVKISKRSAKAYYPDPDGNWKIEFKKVGVK